MSKQQKNGAQEIDEHDLPTEPMPFPAMPPLVPGDNTMPAFPPPAPPSPQQQRQIFLPPQPAWDEPQGDKIYPQPAQPPPKRRGKKNRQPIAAAPVQPVHPAQPAYNKQPARQRARRSAVPALVKLFFRLVELLLLARALLGFARITGLWTSNAAWVNVIYALGNACIVPVSMLWQQVHIPFIVGPEIYALLGIVLYELLSRIVVGILRVIFRP